MAETAITMPKLGLTMTEGLLAEWLVAPGDSVAAGQPLFVVETDKISNEIEAPAEGRIIAFQVAAGETVPVGAVLATWTGPGASMAEQPLQSDSNRTEPTEQHARMSPAGASTVAIGAGQRILSTPLARRAAREAGLDLAIVRGSGPRGRIQARDVAVALVEVRPADATIPVSSRGSASGGARRGLRQMIAARVSRSKAEVPHFYVTAEVRLDRLNALRAELNGATFTSRKLSITAFLAIAADRALAALPEANVIWRDGDVRKPAGRAIGIAVEAAEGVLAPVVPISGSIGAFAEAMDEAVARARSGRLAAQDMHEAAMGLSNVGMIPVRSLTPIIDPDQTYMLGVGAPKKVFRPGPSGEPFVVEEIILTLACDHRAVDGALAARLLAAIVERIESPLSLLT